jgi:hypothetical protein
MDKKNKILILLLAVLLVLVFYLILTSESIKQTENLSQEIKSNKAVILEANYQNKASQIFTDYEKLLQDKNFTVEKITELKNELLGLKVPAKFKELHIQFVQALDKMENYLSRKDEQEKNTSQQMINQLKADFGWLNK